MLSQINNTNNRICCLYLYVQPKQLELFNKIKTCVGNIDFYAIHTDWDDLYNKYSQYMINDNANKYKHEGDIYERNGLYVGNSIWITIDFYKQNPQYDYYIIMEYDVRFTGYYSHFFSIIASNIFVYDYIVQSDFVKPEPDWWWLHHQCFNEIPEKLRYKNLYQFCAFSGRVINYIYNEYVDKQYLGHYEYIVSIILKHSNFKYLVLSDIINTKMKIKPRELTENDLKLKNTLIHPIK